MNGDPVALIETMLKLHVSRIGSVRGSARVGPEVMRPRYKGSSGGLTRALPRTVLMF